jgi:flagellar protein FlbT
VHALLDAIPRLTGHIDEINEHILIGNYYRALKLARELIDYEQEVLKHADPGTISENI